jgi:iron complex outermembrane recepter protein
MNGRIRCTMKSTIASAIALMVLVWAAPMAQAQAKAAFDLPAQPLADSLRAVGSQTNINLLFDPPLVAGRKAPALKVEVTADEALTRLLVGTGIKHEFLNETTIVLAKADAGGSKSSQGGASSSATSTEPGKDVPKEGQKSADSFRVAQVDQGKGANAPSVASHTLNSQENSNSPSPGLSEIIVTAQKRTERLQDVPVPVTSIEAQSLVANNQLRLQDYFTNVPGLSLAPGASTQSQQFLAIRGITTGFGNPTVGVLVDDIPYGSSTSNGGGLVVPDIDPGDLARIEVLRGPQGTLYGASSMGGLLKFVTLDPSTESVSGRVQAGISSVYNGAELGYNARASVNVPLSDTLAVRVSGFTREDPGYIDNPVLHIDGINETRVSGGRVTALWKPSQDLSLKFSALYQDTKGNGLSDVDEPINGYVGPPLGALQQNYIRGVGGSDKQIQAYSLTLQAKVGIADLTSVTGYNVNSFKDSFDYTYGFGTAFPQPYFGAGVDGTPVFDSGTTRKASQEIRLSMPITQRIDWLLGGFYTHENSPYVQTIAAENSATGVVVADGIAFNSPTTYSEYALFTDLTFHISDRIDIQIGGRESQVDQTYSEIDTGRYVPYFDSGAPSPHVVPEVDAKTHAFTYLVTPRFKISSDLMVYARLASGYRAGGPNEVPNAPREYSPDKTNNYEIGLKGDFFEHTLAVDTSLYYIDWKDIQLSVLNPNYLSYTINASRAKSQGIELSVTSRPVAGLAIATWIVWDDAQLTQAFPAGNSSDTYGVPGNRLPYSSRFSGNFSVDEEFPLVSLVKGFVGASVSYTGDREGAFQTLQAPGSPQRQLFPAYAKTDLRAGVRYDSWTANFFVSNVADKRGVLNGGVGDFPPFAFQVIQPRTVGLSVVKSF